MIERENEVHLERVMLVDDSAADNLLHRIVIEDSGLVDEIVEFQYAEAALDYLREPELHPVDLIFLDINMPRMNGFEFLEAYAGLPDERKARVVVTMLTTSMDPSDRERAEATGHVGAFLSKPLTDEGFLALVRERFGAPA